MSKYGKTAAKEVKKEMHKFIDYLYFDKPYYLLPDTKNKKAYVLLREALKKTGKAGVAKMVMRQKEYLSLILPHHDALILYLGG